MFTHNPGSIFCRGNPYTLKRLKALLHEFDIKEETLLKDRREDVLEHAENLIRISHERQSIQEEERRKEECRRVRNLAEHKFLSEKELANERCISRKERQQFKKKEIKRARCDSPSLVDQLDKNSQEYLTSAFFNSKRKFENQSIQNNERWQSSGLTKNAHLRALYNAKKTKKREEESSEPDGEIPEAPRLADLQDSQTEPVQQPGTAENDIRESPATCAETVAECSCSSVQTLVKNVENRFNPDATELKDDSLFNFKSEELKPSCDNHEERAAVDEVENLCLDLSENSEHDTEKNIWKVSEDAQEEGEHATEEEAEQDHVTFNPEIESEGESSVSSTSEHVETSPKVLLPINGRTGTRTVTNSSFGHLLNDNFSNVTSDRDVVMKSKGISCQAAGINAEAETKPKQFLPPATAPPRVERGERLPLYPLLSAETQSTSELKPLSEQQLRSLYFNPEMEYIDEFVDIFLGQAQQERHEFYDIVNSYCQARKQLLGNEKDIEVLRADAVRQQEASWETVAEKVILQGTCLDKSKVSGELTFNIAAFRECEFEQLGESLKKIQEQINNNLTLHAFEAYRSRLQVECYIYRLYNRNPALLNIPINAPIQAHLSRHRDSSITHQVETLKLCISVLFMFIRKPIHDDIFVKDIRFWLSSMVGTLLRLATLEDHLFLLCHILRCPAGIGRWATGFIQSVPLPVRHDAWENTMLDHNVAMLSMLLKHIKGREEMLYEMKVTPVTDAAENPWILVDEAGEEDEDPSNSWLHFQENDIVSLLCQFSIDSIFSHVLYIHEHEGEFEYDVSHTSETGMSKLFAFVSCIIRMVGHGLQNFVLERYRLISKRLGRMTKHIVQYTCDHWSYFKQSASSLTSASAQRLQLELDMVLQRAIICILSDRRLGAWQFLAELPYESVSPSMMWTLLWLMQKGCSLDSDLSQLETHIGVEVCRLKFRNDSGNEEFLENLVRLPESEVTFLLITFSCMARLRPASESDFIEEVAKEIFEISYIYSHTRELCKKSGREYLYSISTKHPFVLSFLLKSIDSSLDKIGNVSHLLCRGLPWHQWIPTEADMKILSKWLIGCEPKSVANQLARIIIDELNFGFSAESGRLFLDKKHHRQMAVLLMDTYIAHLSARPIGRLFLELPKPITPSGKSAVGDDNQLAQWTWSVALRLRLHSHSTSRVRHMSGESSGHSMVDTVDEFVDLTSDASLGSIVKGLLSEHKYSLACYLVLLMTKCGHSSRDFCSEGVNHLCYLVEKLLFVPTINCLYYIAPLFFSSPTSLTSNAPLVHVNPFNPRNRNLMRYNKNIQFMNAMKVLLTADTTQKSYFSFSSNRPLGKTFSGMIESQIKDAELADRRPVEVILFWLNLLTNIDAWHKEKDIVCILDDLVKSSFCRPACFEAVLQFFIETTKTVIHDQPGMLSSIGSWIGMGSKSTSSLIDKLSTSDIVWYSYAVVNAECYNMEEITGLWVNLLQQLYSNDQLPVDKAFASALVSQRLDSSLSLSSLSIYRWVELAVNTPSDHPLLPIILQRFMLRYLGRLKLQQGLTLKESLGDRLFNSRTHNYLIKQLKKYLSETSALLQKSSSTNQFHKKLANFYQSLSYWLDEPRLHSSNLQLSNLPAQYQAQLLQDVFECKKDLWLEFMDSDGLSEQLCVLRHDWNILRHPEPSMGQSSAQSAVDPAFGMSPRDRILERVKRAVDRPVEPPSVSVMKSPVPELNQSILCDQQNLLFTLHANFSSIIEYAKLYSVRVSKNVALDCSFLELIPKLYKNVRTESTIHLPCSRMFNPTHRCKGPALVTHTHDQEKKDELIYRRIEENRATYKQVMIESLLPPPQNVCASVVFVENAIRDLITLMKTTPNQSTCSAATNVGIALFYAITTYISEETRFYPPSQKFFAFCIEVLGKEFIRNNPSQSQALLQAILQTPSLSGLLAPNFCPNKSPELFVAMYEDLLLVPARQGIGVAYNLLTKFDIPEWLETYRPMLSMRDEMIDRVMKGLMKCGREPHSSLLVIFEMYRMHLQHLLTYQFPCHFNSVMILLLKGSEVEQLNVEVWSDFLRSVGWSKVEVEGGGGEEREVLRLHTLMPYNQVCQNTDWLSSHFMCQRLSSEASSSSGLYPQWKIYTCYIAKLLSYLTTNAIIVKSQAANDQSIDSESALYELFQMFTQLYAPWIEPVYSDGQLLQPCLLNDIKLFSDLVTAWIGSVNCLHKTFRESVPAVISCQVYNLLWIHYVEKISVRGVPDHIIAVYHSRLLQLEWKNLFPDINTIEYMHKMLSYPKMSFEFLANVVSQLDWTSIVQFYETREVAQIVIRLHVCMFNVLIHIAADKHLVENTSITPLISSTTIFNWQSLDGESYTQAVDWFIKSCDPKCIIAERTSPAAQGLNLIKISSGFHTGLTTPVTERRCAIMNSVSNTSSVKRQCYVRCVAQLAARCSFIKNLKHDTLGIVVNNLLTDIERTVGYIDESEGQYKESITLCSEVLKVLNSCAPEEQFSAVVLTILIDWILSSPLSRLLFPLLTSACRVLTCHSHTAGIVEACIEAHFSVDVTATDCFGWTKILAVLEMPDRNLTEFLTTAVKRGCYLTLYAHIMQQLPLSTCLADELKHLTTLVYWNETATPNETNESKVFLLWHKILELSIRQLELGGDTRAVVKVLLSFISILSSFCEDRSTQGFFGLIGFGKKSSLTVRFRLVSKGLVTFLSAQLPNDASLRMSPSAPGALSAAPSSSVAPSQHAQQALSHLESLRTNKSYTKYRQHLELILSNVLNPNLHIKHSSCVLADLVAPLFPEFHFLGAVIRDQGKIPKTL